MVEGGAGDEHAARLAKLLEPRRDVDAVAEEVVALDHDVAEIDADAEDDAARGRTFGLTLGDRLLHGDRAGDGIDDRGELDDRAVAHQLDDAALVLGDDRIDRLGAKRLDRGKRAGLVGFDQARIADDVGGQDRRQPALGPFCAMAAPLVQPEPCMARARSFQVAAASAIAGRSAVNSR